MFGFYTVISFLKETVITIVCMIDFIYLVFSLYFIMIIKVQDNEMLVEFRLVS